MNFPITLISVAVIWSVAVITPGPNFFITVRTALGQSRRNALFTALGTSTGTILWGLSGFFGIALLFRTAPWIYFCLKLLGGSYLIYLGLKLIATSARAESNRSELISTDDDPLQGFKLGLLTNLSNPKTAAFVTSLFAATMPADAPFWFGALTAVLMSAISIFWYSTLAYVFSLDRFRRLYLKSRIWLERIAGAIFVGFGLKMVDTEF